MNEPTRSRSRFGLGLRRNFLTGLLVVTPTVVAAWVLYRLFVWVDGILWEELRFGWLREGGIPGAGALTVLLLVLLVGLTVNNYVGRRFYRFWEGLVVRIPLFNKIYVAVKQIGEALLAGDRTVFRAVGLIEYPRKDVWCLVFITEPATEEVQRRTGVRVRSVFLPTTPNPTSGFLLMVPEDDLVELEMTVEDGLKMVISGGAFVPGRPAPPEEPHRGFRFWRKTDGEEAEDAAAAAEEAAAEEEAANSPETPSGGEAPADPDGKPR